MALLALCAPHAMATAQSEAQSVPAPDDMAPAPPPVGEAPPKLEADMDSVRAPVAETAPPAAPTLPPAPDISVTESQLLAILTDPGGTDAVTPATSIPYVVGRSCYSWALKYQPVEGELVLTEQLDLPGPARNWGTEGSRSEVNAQRSGALTERRFNASTGTATAGWCVAKDDPVGSYRFIIRQGEREVARFDFTVGDLL